MFYSQLLVFGICSVLLWFFQPSSIPHITLSLNLLSFIVSSLEQGHCLGSQKHQLEPVWQAFEMRALHASCAFWGQKSDKLSSESQLIYFIMAVLHQSLIQYPETKLGIEMSYLQISSGKSFPLNSLSHC